MTRYFNTTLGISMLPDGDCTVETVTEETAAQYLLSDVENVANPSHGNSLQAITQLLGADVCNPKGGRVFLKSGDSCLVAEVSGIPRETREFTNEEIEAATFRFRIVYIK